MRVCYCFQCGFVIVLMSFVWASTCKFSHNQYNKSISWLVKLHNELLKSSKLSTFFPFIFMLIMIVKSHAVNHSTVMKPKNDNILVWQFTKPMICYMCQDWSLGMWSIEFCVKVWPMSLSRCHYGLDQYSPNLLIWLIVNIN